MNANPDVITPQDLTVAYKGQGYSNLLLYSVRLENNGNSAVEDQEILISL